MPDTYSSLYLSVRRALRQRGLPAADLEARELVCHASGKRKEDLIRDGSLYISRETADRTWELVERHLAGEPVAYIIGEWEFYGLTLDIGPEVLIPRPDTEILAREAIGALRASEKKRGLDLCAGSGCVGLAVASQVPGSRIVLGERYDGALRLCHQNYRRCKLTHQVLPLKIDALEPPDPVLGTFSCIFSNPPYVPTEEIQDLDPSVRDHEPWSALDGGADGLLFYRVIAERWQSALTVGGRLLFEVGIGQAEAVREILREAGLTDIGTVPDLNGIERVVGGTLPASVVRRDRWTGPVMIGGKGRDA